MAESYEDIMARLNKREQTTEPPKAANDFANYVKTLLENPNPQGGMMSDAEAYYADPFRKQRAIRQANLEEELSKKKQAEEAAKMAADTGSKDFIGGDSGQKTDIDPAVAAYLAAENSTARGIRGNSLINALGSIIVGSPMGSTSGLFGMTDSMGGVTPGRLAQMAYRYNTAPDIVKSLLPESYANAAGFLAQNDAIFGGYNPSGSVTMGPQQSAALAAQDAGLFDSPAERAAWYAENSGGDSGGGGASADGFSSSGGGDYGFAADGYGGYI